MDSSLQDLKGFSISVSIFEKLTFINDKKYSISKSENLLFARNAVEIFVCDTAE